MKKLAPFILAHRKAVVLVIIVLTLVLGYCIKDLRVDPDIINYLPDTDPVVKLSSYINQEYGGNLLAMVALENPDLFTPAGLQELAALTSRLEQVEGVLSVTSLTNILDIKGEEGFIEIGPAIELDYLPATPAGFEELKTYLLSKKLYRGKLLSEDATTTLLICRLQDDTDQVRTTRAIIKAAEEMGYRPNALARALVTDARVLILDEPTAVLSPAGIEALFERVALIKAGAPRAGDVADGEAGCIDPCLREPRIAAAEATGAHAGLEHQGHLDGGWDGGFTDHGGLPDDVDEWQLLRHGRFLRWGRVDLRDDRAGDDHRRFRLGEGRDREGFGIAEQEIGATDLGPQRVIVLRQDQAVLEGEREGQRHLSRACGRRDGEARPVGQCKVDQFDAELGIRRQRDAFAIGHFTAECQLFCQGRHGRDQQCYKRQSEPKSGTHHILPRRF